MTLTRSALAAALLLACTALTSGLTPSARAADAGYGTDKPAADAAKDKPADGVPDGGFFKPEEVGSDASVTIGGQKIDYHAVVGTIVVHPRDWDDAPQKPAGDDKSGSDSDKNTNAEAAMSFVGYFKKGVPAAHRPMSPWA